MAIAAGAEERSQDPQIPTPGPADPVGIQYARLHAGDVLDQDSSQEDEADIAGIAPSDDSFTTDDEESTDVGGKQTWTMSFEWQDESGDNAPDTFTSFEESTDFGRPSLHSANQTSPSSTSGSNSEAAEANPADSDHNWVQPWSSVSSEAPYSDQDQSNNRQHTKESQPKPKADPMTDEHKTAILGAMKNVKMDYIPRWAMQFEERQWLNAIKQKASAKNSARGPKESVTS